MKDKLVTIKANLLILIRRIEKVDCSEEINYNLFQKLEEINEKIGEIETLIKEMEAIGEI
jgi:hypothetical protein